MMGAGYIKLWRSLLKWEWYSDVNASRLFIHLLLTVNCKDTVWRGETIRRGQRLTSVAKLSDETGLTTKEVRTALGKLSRTKELTIKTTNKSSLITVEKYDSFQSSDNEEGKQENGYNPCGVGTSTISTGEEGKQPGKQRASNWANKMPSQSGESDKQPGKQEISYNSCAASVSAVSTGENGEQTGTQTASTLNEMGQTTGQQLKNKRNIYSSCGGDGILARAHEEAESVVASYMGCRNLDASAYFGVSEQEIATVAAYTDAIFARFTRRLPTDADRASVFQATRLSEQDEQTGMWTVSFPRDRIELLMYAFEQAALAGKPGDWKYINGVLGRLAQRGITALNQVELYDLDRDENKGAF